MLSNAVRNYSLAHNRHMKIILNAITPYSKDIVKLHAKAGRIKLFDAIFLADLVNKYKPSHILEIGSFLGFSTYWLLVNSIEFNSQLTAIDPNIRHRIFDNPKYYLEMLTEPYRHRLHIVTAFLGEYNDGVYYDYDHYDPKFSREIAQGIISKTPIILTIEEPFDFVFIDGDHSYESTMSNFRSCVRSLKKGGVITFHDALSWPGVKKALSDIKSEYIGNAEVFTLGLKIPRLCDGIGVFRMIN